MKAFLLALVALVVITVGADYALNQAGFSSAEQYSSDDVRLGD